MSQIFREAINVSEISKILGVPYTFSDDKSIEAIGDSNDVLPNSICDYIKGPLPEKVDGLVILSKEEIEGYDCIIVPFPQEAIIEVIEFVESNIGFVKKYQGCKLPESTKLGKNVVIEDNVSIGENCVIEHNVVIHSGTKIGNNCLIRTHSSIGGDGFGYIKKGDNYIKQRHLGGVVIGDNVEVGSNCCIVRGIVNDTIINKNVKIDNLVHIAHDCFIDENSLIIANAELSGYVKIGKNTRVAPSVCIKQRVTIGDNVLIGMGAVVLKNIKNDTVVFGNPAKPLRQFGKK